jgi:hypothetical protein
VKSTNQKKDLCFTLPFFLEVLYLFGFPSRMIVFSSLDPTLSSFLDGQAIASIIDLIWLSFFVLNTAFTKPGCGV